MSEHRRTDHEGEVEMGRTQHPEAGYDHSDLGARGIIGFFIGMAVMVIFILILAWGFIRTYAHFEPKPLARTSAITVPEAQTGPKGDPASRFPAPQLQSDEAGDMNQYREAVEQQLNSSGWIDQQAGVAHIPVERAIDLVAQRGLPVRPEQPQTQPAKLGSGVPHPSKGSLGGPPEVVGAAGGTVPHGNK